MDTVPSVALVMSRREFLASLAFDLYVMSRKIIVRLVGGSALLIGLFYLFLASVRDTESEPLVIATSQLDGWTMAVEAGPRPEDPVLSLRPPRDLPMSLMRQIFQRTMESLSAPVEPAIALILRGELESARAGTLSPDELMLIAHGVGLASASPRPGCLAVRRGSDPSEPRQIFFLLFDLPEFGRFRSEVAALLDTRGGSQPPFDPDALWPILMFAASERDVQRWMMSIEDPAKACIAPARTG